MSRPFFLRRACVFRSSRSEDLYRRVLPEESRWSRGFRRTHRIPVRLESSEELVEYVGYFETKNNRMELRACVFAHEWILDQGENLRVGHVQIVTDSRCVFENYNRAIGWSRNAWRNSHGRPLENVDLWKELLRVRRTLGFGIRLELKLIAGKSTPITKAVDRDAKAAATMPTQVDRGFQSGKIGRSKNNTGKAAKLFPAIGQEITIRVYQTATIRREEQKIKFQLYSPEAKDFIEKFVAYVHAAVGNQLHRQNVYIVRMNDVPEYPKILEIVAEVKESDLAEEVVN